MPGQHLRLPGCGSGHAVAGVAHPATVGRDQGGWSGPCRLPGGPKARPRGLWPGLRRSPGPQPRVRRSPGRRAQAALTLRNAIATGPGIPARPPITSGWRSRGGGRDRIGLPSYHCRGLRWSGQVGSSAFDLAKGQVKAPWTFGGQIRSAMMTALTAGRAERSPPAVRRKPRSDPAAAHLNASRCPPRSVGYACAGAGRQAPTEGGGRAGACDPRQRDAEFAPAPRPKPPPADFRRARPGLTPLPAWTFARVDLPRVHRRRDPTGRRLQRRPGQDGEPGPRRAAALRLR